MDCTFPFLEKVRMLVQCFCIKALISPFTVSERFSASKKKSKSISNQTLLHKNVPLLIATRLLFNFFIGGSSIISTKKINL